MILRQHESLDYYQFPNLEAFNELWHGIFTRKDQGPALHQSLNVSFNVGDSRERVVFNRKRILACSGGKTLTAMEQVHGTQIRTFFPPIKADESAASVCATGDAAMTNIPGKMLLIQVADCQPVFLYAADRRIAAIVHTGWRGSIQNILGKTVRALRLKEKCNPEYMHAGIGPSLGPCCAEFINYREEIPEVFWSYKDQKDHFDFWAISRNQLCQEGVLNENIHIAGICTKCRADQFFSYRKEKHTGRFAGVIGLRPTEKNKS